MQKNMAQWWKLLRKMMKRDEQHIQKQWQNDDKLWVRWWNAIKKTETMSKWRRYEKHDELW